jgi:subtilisin family serine protease
LIAGAIAVAVAAIAATALLAPPRLPDVALERLEEAVALGILDQEVVDDLRGTGEAQAIVHLNSGPILDRLTAALGPDRGAELIDAMSRAFSENKRAILSALGPSGEMVRDFDPLGAFLVRFRSEEGLLVALRSSLVRAVLADLAFSVPKPVVDAGGEPPLSPSRYVGSGVAIGVLDTGIDVLKGPEYFPVGSIVESRELARNDGKADDDGHGTHVSSTVLLVAPRAALYVADVFEEETLEDGTMEIRGSAVLDGLVWMLELKAKGINLRAVNMSLGHGHFAGVCVDRYNLEEVYRVGIIPVVSAGNSAFENDKDEPMDSYQPGLGSPACGEYALSVGAVTNGSCGPADTYDQVTEFSQASAELDMLAPGKCIRAAGGVMSGTSMAAPQVSGAVAVLASARDASTSEIWNALVRSGPSIPDKNAGLSRNRLDIPAAVQSLLTGAVPETTPRTGPEIAVTMGPSPVSVAEEVAPGGSYVLSRFGVRNVGSMDATYRLQISPPNQAIAHVAPPSWFTLNPTTVTLPSGAYEFVATTLRVPADAAPGTYAALIVSSVLPTNATPATEPGRSAVRVEFTVRSSGAADMLSGVAGTGLTLLLILGAVVVGIWFMRRRSART